MDILIICITGIVGSILALIVKQYKPEFAILITVVASVVILFIIADYIFEAVSVLSSLSEKTGIESEMMSSILKIIGVGYITEFSSNICEDSGNKSIGDKINLGGKIIILIVALPVLTAVIEVISGLIAV